MSPVAALLTAGGAPERLVEPVVAVLGPDPADAAAALAADPWRLLDVPGVRPDQADAYARTLAASGSAAPARPDDARRGTALAAWLLRRAAADGHTALPAATVRSALGGGSPAPTSDGRVVAVADEGGRPLLALAELAALEAEVAEDAALLAASEPDPVPGLPATGLSVVVATTAAARRAHVADLVAAAEAAGLRAARAPAGDLAVRAGVLANADLAVVEDAEVLRLRAFADLLGALDDGQRLVLVGDPALLPVRGPGQVLADLVAAGVPTVELPDPPPASVLDELRAAVRAGRLPAVDDPRRSVVVVPADDATAVQRAVQLVTTSIPRAFGVEPREVLVVSPRRGGVAGADALAAALRADARSDAATATTVHEAGGRRAPAVVVVLPAESAGALSRPLVRTAFGLAEQHLSVVHACGPALAEAVARVPRRPRLTRLAGLLRAAQSSS